MAPGFDLRDFLLELGAGLAVGGPADALWGVPPLGMSGAEGGRVGPSGPDEDVSVLDVRLHEELLGHNSTLQAY